MKFNSSAFSKCGICCRKLDTGKDDFRVLLSKQEQHDFYNRYSQCFDEEGKLFVDNNHNCIFYIEGVGCSWAKEDRPKECLLFPLTVVYNENGNAKRNVYKIWKLCPEVKELVNSLKDIKNE